MIKVKVKKNNNKIEYISITGHAMYDDFGKDIVCSSVSSIVITTVNAIERICKGSISYEEKPFYIKIEKENDITEKLIQNMISLLKELEQSYPKNIRFLEEE